MNIIALTRQAIGYCQRVPDELIILIARFSIAAIFWKSGQTKIQGFAIDIVHGDFLIGIPRLADSTIELFRHEYRLPLLPPEFAATMATLAENTLPIFILIGLATRFSALALLGMTTVIQLFVYPDAYPTHGVWAVVLLFLMTRGPGRLSLDHLIAQRYR